MAEVKRDKLCKCGVCEISYELLELVDMFLTDAMVDKVLGMCRPEEREDILRTLGKTEVKAWVKARILINAAAELGVAEGAPADVMFLMFTSAWNRRAYKILAQTGEAVPDQLPKDWE